ncbi:eCIS core domain-containing protein [Leptolyngbya sp. AN02str]|uniref:eCIS core domain-containing protein n=1 Tax=Leptolyngbya sp. AN02str TaxID=3423363 RepID=UPI003D31336C
MGVLHQSRNKEQVAAKSLGAMATAGRGANLPENSAEFEPMHDVTQRPQFGGLSGELGVTSARMPIQTKMKVGAAGDRYEQEADRLAPLIVRQINTPDFGKQHQDSKPEIQEDAASKQVQALRPILQLKGESTGGSVSPAIESAITSARGGGLSLEPGLQQRLEQSMGINFSQVRVHTDTRADQLNQALSSRAFTAGHDLFFKQGEYQPGSPAGQALIAHELTHVVQQRSAQARTAKLIQRAIYHTFNGEPSPVKWTGTAAELYDKLNTWLEDNLANEGVPALKDQWDEKGRAGIIHIIKSMKLKRGKWGNLVTEMVHRSTALTRVKQTFVNEENAVRKILAEGYRERATQKEGDLAQQVIDGTIVDYLKSVARRVQAWSLYQKYKEGMKGEYTHYWEKRWYKGGKLRKLDIDAVLSSSNDFKKLISALHDVTTFLYRFAKDKTRLTELKDRIQHLDKELDNLRRQCMKAQEDGKMILAVAKERQLLSKRTERDALYNELVALTTEKGQAHGAVSAPPEKSVSSYSYEAPAQTEAISQVRPTVSSYSYIDETSLVMKKVRESEMLVEVGPSYTTARLMQLCETVGCDDNEKIAVALAIFAFWNKNYWKSASGIHRFHFVMDMCKNYVPSLNYNFAYPDQISELAPFLVPEGGMVA